MAFNMIKKYTKELYPTRGMCGKHHSEETKLKMKKSQNEYFKNHHSNNYGKINSEESNEKRRQSVIKFWSNKDNKERMFKAMKVKHKPMSKEEKLKVSARGKEYYKTHINPMTGRSFKFSNEAKQKCRIKRIEYIKRTCPGFIPLIGKYEKQILDELQNKIGFSIKRQFYINGYYLDGYCQELNLAIEVDEPYHYRNNVLRKEDIERQKNIINTLNCNFIRIKIEDVIKNDDVILNNVIPGKWYTF